MLEESIPYTERHPELDPLFIMDIDNVLNTDDHIEQMNDQAGIENYEDFKDYFHKNPAEYLQPERVQRLDECLDELDPDPRIVTVSSWQTSFGADFLTQVLEKAGFTHEIWTRTMNFHLKKGGRERGQEIRYTVKNVDPDHCVVLDDRPYNEWFNFVHHQIQPEDGLEPEHVEQIHELWNRPFEKKPGYPDEDDGPTPHVNPELGSS